MSLVLGDLAVVRGVSVGMLTEDCIDIYPGCWSPNPLSMSVCAWILSSIISISTSCFRFEGAFAFFGPGEFSTAVSLHSPEISASLEWP